MRIRVEIPDKLHSKLVRQAKAEDCSLASLIVRAVEAALSHAEVAPKRRIKLPVVHSKKPGTLHLDNSRIFELIDFP